MKTPKVSVLIPTYKYARFLPEAIESVLGQDFENFELLIVDDCSPDNTAGTVQPYCGRDSRVRFEVNAVNRGMVPNWNYCLSQARGEYIKFVFGDDRLESPGALRKMVAMLEQNPSAKLAVSARKVTNEHSRWINTWDHMGKDGVYEGRGVIIRCLGSNSNLIGEPSAVMFRKADATRGFDPAYKHLVDLEMWFQLIENGSLVYTTETLCGFRQHGAQQTVVNESQNVGTSEMIALLKRYAAQPWSFNSGSFADRCELVYKLRQTVKRSLDSGLESTLANYEQSLAPAQLLAYWPISRLKRMTTNLKRSIQKRIIRSRP